MADAPARGTALSLVTEARRQMQADTGLGRTSAGRSTIFAGNIRHYCRLRGSRSRDDGLMIYAGELLASRGVMLLAVVVPSRARFYPGNLPRAALVG